jgi:hypothetical protein
MTRRLLLVSTFAALAGSTLGADPVAPARPVVVPCPPGCTAGPEKVVVHRPAYGTKCESFCLRSISLAGFWKKLCGEDCGPVNCDPPRGKTRLVKWDVSEERVQVKCAVEKPCPIVAPGPVAAPGPLSPSPFIVIQPKK